MRALVLGGAGAVCQETTRDLSRYSDFEEIVVADFNVAAAQAIVEELDDDRLQAIPFDAKNYEAMLEIFPKFDVVVNGLPFKYDYPVNKACVAVGINGLDLSSEDPQFALHDAALEKEMLFIPGVGATPGVTNMMAAQGVSHLDTVEEIQVNFAAFRCLAPAPGLMQTTIWEFHPDQEERAYYEDGVFYSVPPFAGEKVADFPEPIGQQKVFVVPHDETYTFSRSYRKMGLRRVSTRGCFPPHVMRLMKSMLEAGLFSEEPIELLNTQTNPLAAMEELLLALPVSKENPIWAYGLIVELWGQRSDRQVKITYWNTHPPMEEWGGKAAYYKNVGIPLSIGAQMLAKGQVKGRGVLPPEQTLDPAIFFSELTRRGIIVHERVEEHRSIY
jgi:saccharopine dehydrogenase-like NADP-dependent oxidoreductase